MGGGALVQRHSRLPVELPHGGLPAACGRLLGADGPAKPDVALRRLEAGSRSGSRGAAGLGDRAPVATGKIRGAVIILAIAIATVVAAVIVVYFSPLPVLRPEHGRPDS